MCIIYFNDCDDGSRTDVEQPIDLLPSLLQGPFGGRVLTITMFGMQCASIDACKPELS